MGATEELPYAVAEPLRSIDADGNLRCPTVHTWTGSDDTGRCAVLELLEVLLEHSRKLLRLEVISLRVVPGIAGIQHVAVNAGHIPRHMEREVGIRVHGDVGKRAVQGSVEQQAGDLDFHA